MRRAACLLALFWGAATVGCQRKAPGPFECQEIAARSLGIRTREQLSDPRVREAYDAFTHECLTTPFDRRLVRCLEETGRTRACFIDFQQRRDSRR